MRTPPYIDWGQELDGIVSQEQRNHILVKVSSVIEFELYLKSAKTSPQLFDLRCSLITTTPVSETRRLHFWTVAGCIDEALRASKLKKEHVDCYHIGDAQIYFFGYVFEGVRRKFVQTVREVLEDTERRMKQKYSSELPKEVGRFPDTGNPYQSPLS